MGNGTIEVSLSDKNSEPLIFSTERVCPKCKQGFRKLDPQDFSFRSKRGQCKKCLGRGEIEKRKELVPCPECKGSRLSTVGNSVYINGKTIFELSSLNSKDLSATIKKFKFDSRLGPILEPILTELNSKLSIISAVGLDYLSLNRNSSTISGGEAQRLRLAKTLGSPLTGVCYVLDEPTIGLHPKDQELLDGLLKQLKSAGNTIVVVEHDDQVILNADYVIDIGPHGGKQGGEVVFSGEPKELVKDKISVTAKCLRERKTRKKILASPKFKKKIKIEKANANNLKNVSATIPLNSLSVVCGVSGSGKSTLVHECLVPEVISEFEGKKSNKSNFRVSGLDSLSRLIEIDQSPLGKTSSSCPASYLGIMEHIRKLYAMLPEAKSQGFNHQHFSFNTGKGRCDECSGKGYVKIPMSFLPDAVSLCETCKGQRYNAQTEEIKYNGLSIGDLLQTTMDEAREILERHKFIKRSLDYVHELGLGYISLGQASHTLSGGEAQRLKIAKELGARNAEETLYILDEPTIGLHMNDVGKLISVLRKLIEKGNTVLVIEHNLDVIKEADYLIELGPGAAEKGGKVIFQGTPKELKKKKTNTAGYL